MNNTPLQDKHHKLWSDLNREFELYRANNKGPYDFCTWYFSDPYYVATYADLIVEDFNNTISGALQNERERSINAATSTPS